MRRNVCKQELSGMVSTRGPRYKFTEGEKVLCYEPDPTKAKVLYDSKVLEVVKTKDKRGRPLVEYLIHFQGWNSSWDRCVSEDFVLKDTDENRQLQRSLADKAQLQIGAYLYRRERKKTTSSHATSTTEKRRRKQGMECEGSSSSGDPEAFTERDEQDETESSSESDSSSTTTEEQKNDASQDPQTSLANAAINLSPQIRDRLTADYYHVMKYGRLLTLPAKPNVLEILEGCVKQYAAREASAKSRQRRSRATNPPAPQEELTQLLNRLNLMHEVADGIRVYFDFLLIPHLLYKPEDAQYREAVYSKILREARHVSFNRKDEHQNNSSPKVSIKTERHSPQEEYAHLPPSPKTEEHHQNTSDRRLRSHKQSHTESCEEPSQSNNANNANVAGPSNVEPNSSSVSGSPRPTDLTNINCGMKGAFAGVIHRAMAFRLVPPETPPFPSAVYGATHLARLFVKLPEFLSATNMADVKLKLIIRFIDIFVEYLDEHEEWFGEPNYHKASSGPS